MSAGLGRLSSPASAKLIALSLALGSIFYHWKSAQSLGVLSSALSEGAPDDSGGADFFVFEAVRACLGTARLLNFVLVLVGAVGAYGIYGAHLPFIRLFALSSLLSVAGEGVLLVLFAVVAASGSSSTLTSTVCEAVSSADLLAFDSLGWSLDTCDERVRPLALAGLGAMGAVALVRLLGALFVLSWYTKTAKKHRRSHVPKLSLSLHRAYSDQPPVPHQRIFLLPHQTDDAVPLVQVTSPSNSSFPPMPSTGDAEPTFLVFAPVMMTEEEAKRRGARCIQATRSRTRSHSGSHNGSPITPGISTFENAILSPEIGTSAGKVKQI